MSKAWQLVVIGLIGLGVGAALDEGLHALRSRTSRAGDRDSTELFQQKLRCKNEADAYMRSTSEDGNGAPMLEVVEFSPLRHSCVAEFTRVVKTGGGREIWTYETVDILTGEALFSDLCIMNDPKAASYCGGGRDMQIRANRDKALQAALSKSKE